MRLLVFPKYPSAHGLHDDDSADDEYRPGGQAAIVPLVQNDPEGHTPQTVLLSKY